MAIADIFNASYFYEHIFDDLAIYNTWPQTGYGQIFLMNTTNTANGTYAGVWPDTYRYPNGDYILMIRQGYNNLSQLTPRTQQAGTGIVYNYSRFTLNNPGQIQLEVLEPTLNAVVSGTVNITANITSPEPILSVEFFVYNYSQYFFYGPGAQPMANGTLTNITTIYNATWDTLTVPSTVDYMLRVAVTDANDTFYYDNPITVNNTFYQENVPIYAPMGSDSGLGYDLWIGSLDLPQVMDPDQGSMWGGPPPPHMFYGYGVDWGMDLHSTLYQDAMAVFILADNNQTDNFLMAMLSTDLPPFDYGISIMLPDDSPQSQETADAIVEEFRTAFSIPSALSVLDIIELEMGPGVYASMFMYGANYSSIQYDDFIDKFHSSVPAGMAGVYTKENMTQAGVNSSIFFGYYGPGLIPPIVPPNYNIGYGAFILPSIGFPDYFSPTLGANWEVSLNEIFPQISQYNACSPSVASDILSGFGPNVFAPSGAIAMNANITGWYPTDPMSVFPFPAVHPSITSLVTYIMLDTVSMPIPYGLLTTDDIRINFTGPFITNDLITPYDGQSVQQEDYNVTMASQSLMGTWNKSKYQLGSYGFSNGVGYGEDLEYDGDNWTNIIHSLDLPAGPYQLVTYTRENNYSLWAMDEIIIHINNTAYTSAMCAIINELGDVELLGGDPGGSGFFGYGVDLGLDLSLPEYNATELISISIEIAAEDTFNDYSGLYTDEQWNLIIIVEGDTTEEILAEIAEPIIEDLESVFGISGLLQPIEDLDLTLILPRAGLGWAMNFTPSRDYDYFLDQYETVVCGNLSGVFSKENMLLADQSSIKYQIRPLWAMPSELTNLGWPALVDFGDPLWVFPWMRFEDVYQYTDLEQPYNFSLADLLGISELNTNYEQNITYSYSYYYTLLFCGNYTEVYPNVPGNTTYIGPFFGEIYHYFMINKSCHLQSGILQTDDLNFTFTAPQTLIEIMSPTFGSTVHGDVNLIVNASSVFPTTNNIMVRILEAGAYSPISQYAMYDPLATFSIAYDPIAQCWNGTWETLNVTFVNGWYDILFYYQDALGRPQLNITRVYLWNTYYGEDMGIYIDQFGNVTADFSFSGNVKDHGLDLSLPEYQEPVLIAMQATNSYSGSSNYSKTVLAQWANSLNDYGLSIMFGSHLSEAEALQIATPIKDDFEQAFGIVGLLNFIDYAPFFLMMPGVDTMYAVYYGANYTGAMDYSHFADRFHQGVPPGLNNTIPTSTLMGTDGFMQWVLFPDPSLSFSEESPPNMPGLTLDVMLLQFYPQYFGADYMGSSLDTHTLSVPDLFGLPQMVHASPDVADTMESRLEITLENAYVIDWYPNISRAEWEPNDKRYQADLARGFPYQTYDEEGYQDEIWDLTVDDINITFEESVSRPLVVTPLAAGPPVDGITTIEVSVENRSPIQDVTCKIYTQADYDYLPMMALMGGGGMPNGRPPSAMYGQQTMNSMGGGKYNCSWLAYQHADGPMWFEIVVATTDGYYSYNSTKVTIANSNPLAINVISPADGASVSGITTISAQVINSTPVGMVKCVIYEATPMLPVGEIMLEPQGGGVYSTPWGSHGVFNGTYQLMFQVQDTNGAKAINITSIDVSNPVLFELGLLHPTSTLDWSPTANITVNATGPYYTKTIYYEVYQQYSSRYEGYKTESFMTSGMMVDPDSTWITQIDTSTWPKMLNISDYGRYDIYDAYYQIQLTATDTGYAQAICTERFLLGDPEYKYAEIISPNHMDGVNYIFNVTVNVTTFGDTFNNLEGRVLDLDDNVIQDLSFYIYPNGSLAKAEIVSYIHQNGYYTIEIWGATGLGAFYDDILVGFNDMTIFSIRCIYPGDSDTVTGDIIVQLDVQNVTSISTPWVEIYEDEQGPWLTQLNSFQYNGSSGYWEQLWDTSELSDGAYYLRCRVQDYNNIYVEDELDFSVNNPPSVWIIDPIGGSYGEYVPIPINVSVNDISMDRVELWANGSYIMDLAFSGGYWIGVWSYTIGKIGNNSLNIKAYDTAGLVNDTEWTWVIITPFTPPEGQADVYEVVTTNSTGGEQTTFTEGETVDYHATIRGDAGNSTYVVTAQTDDPDLLGYLSYNETVTVTAGEDLEVVFNYTIAVGAPAGTYTVYILIWTDWPWDGGYCVDFITITFEVV